MSDILRIGMIAPLTERIPPHTYGGTERVVSWLTEYLVDKGHSVTLFASGDSITKARLVAGSEKALRLSEGENDSFILHLQMLSEIFREYEDCFDIIHSHIDYMAFPFLLREKTPSLVTMHGRLDYKEYTNFINYYNKINYVSISDYQRRPVPNVNWAGTVYHGMPKDLLLFTNNPEDYFLFLGRITKEKRPDIAINIAKRLGIKLKIAAKVDKVDVEYFEKEILPLMDSPFVEYVGEVNDQQKESLLNGAIALLNTIDWPEPFGLVMIEALACGTPVITKRFGSTPEIIEHGNTGFICDTEYDFITAIKNIEKIDRKNCRKSFKTRFTSNIMTEKYLSLYRSLIERNPSL